MSAAIAAACLVALAGCDGTPAPSPSPTATVNPTPPETSLERQQREDFEAAEKAYRTFMAEYNRLIKSGGASSATPVMKETAGGPLLAFYTQVLRQQAAAGQRSTSDVKIGYLRPSSYSTSELTLDVCEDASDNKVLDSKNRVVGRGQVLKRSIIVRPVDGRWRLWDGEERGTVKSCSES